MKNIIQLDYHLINKIAAGEVVERPLSVVKELTENAIDAGASAITVELTDGGLTSIRVTDNGSGIPAGQLPLAFARHATSKITSLDDLFDVRTLGFRGEALCSIASVAQVEMVTKTVDAVMGTRIEVHGGQKIANQPVGCINGTTVVVNNLFYNTPARRKFLKKNSTEAGYVSDCIGRLALSHPGLSFRYINNGQLTLQTSGSSDLKTTIMQVYGREIATKLVTVEAESGAYTLRGYVGKPEIARGNRQYGNFFINSRYIQSKLVQQAVEAAMKTLLPAGRFPVYILFFNLPPEAVDVNVHPTKMDVRFADEEGVLFFIQENVRRAMSENNLIPEVRLVKRENTGAAGATKSQATRPVREAYERVYSGEAGDTVASGGQTAKRDRALVDVEPAFEEITLTDTPVVEQSAQNASSFSEIRQKMPSPKTEEKLVFQEAPPPPKIPLFNDYQIHGLLFGTYWLVAQGESFYLIDQHAAHERVLYEKMMQDIQQQAVPSQALLEPLPLRLTPKESELITEHSDLFEKFGFILTKTNPPALTAVPFILKGPLPTVLLTDLLDTLEEAAYTPSLKENAVAMMACKAAVKANDRMTEPEAKALIKKMLELENPFTCPHGRPTAIEITKKEVERKFKRT